MPAAETTPTPQEPTPRQRRSVITLTLLRALAIAALLVVLYYFAPMDTVLDTHAVLLLVLCLAVFAVTVIWQVRSITHSQYPGLRAIETVAAVVPLYILGFAASYFVMERTNSAYFSQPLTRTGALYFSMTVFSTVGFGDITAKTDAARAVVTIQMFFDLIVLGFGVRAFLSAVQLGRQRRTPRQQDDSFPTG
jgi:voltage-gated potassium channel